MASGGQHAQHVDEIDGAALAGWGFEDALFR
jgi:hypothetical protein